jgi:hypothetical protein
MFGVTAEVSRLRQLGLAVTAAAREGTASYGCEDHAPRVSQKSRNGLRRYENLGPHPRVSPMPAIALVQQARCGHDGTPWATG